MPAIDAASHKGCPPPSCGDLGLVDHRGFVTDRRAVYAYALKVHVAEGRGINAALQDAAYSAR